MPTTTIPITSMAAKTGRRMQTAASVFMAVSASARDGRCRRARAAGGPVARGQVGGIDDAHALAADEIAGIDDDLLAAIEAADDLDPVALAAAGVHALLDALAILHDEHLVDAGEGDDRRGRNHDRLLLRLDDDLGVREGAGAQLTLRVRHFRFHHQRAARL